MKTIDDVIQKLEYIMESDPRTFSNPECEYEWAFHRVNEAIKMLKEIEKEPSFVQSEIIKCKDCRKHNISPKEDPENCCPLYHYRGMSFGSEHDLEFCSYAKRKGE